MIRVSSILGWSFAIFAGSLHAQDLQKLDGEPETIGRYLLSMPARTLDPIIEHCSQKRLELRAALMKERAGFFVKLGEANKPLMTQLNDDPEFNAPIEESMRQNIADAHARGLSTLKQQDPNTTCRMILANIQNATVDGLREVIEDTYQKFRDATPAQEPQQP